MLSRGGIQAQTVLEERKAARQLSEKAIKGVVHMSKTGIDGVTYAATSLFQGFIGGVTFGYGDMVYNDGYKTRVDVASYKFSWSRGFEVDKKFATRGNLDFNDGMRVLDGVGSMMTSGEITVLTEAIVTPIIRRELAKAFYRKAGGNVAHINGYLQEKYTTHGLGNMGAVAEVMKSEIIINISDSKTTKFRTEADYITNTDEAFTDNKYLRNVNARSNKGNGKLDGRYRYPSEEMKKLG